MALFDEYYNHYMRPLKGGEMRDEDLEGTDGFHTG